MNRLQFALIGLTSGVFFAVAVLDVSIHADEDDVRLAAAPDAKTDKQSADDEPALAKFMRAKLAASSDVLEGLCTEDFDLITKGAKNLEHVSHAEQWRVSNDVIYRQHSAEFQAGIKRLLKASQKKQIDAAALAWTRTTLNCIECHRWVKAMLVSDNLPLQKSLAEDASQPLIRN